MVSHLLFGGSNVFVTSISLLFSLNVCLSSLHSPPSVHPFMPLLVSSSGQRQFLSPGDSSDGDSSGSEGDVVMLSPTPEVRQDNALTVWWAGPLSPASEGAQEEPPPVVVID